MGQILTVLGCLFNPLRELLGEPLFDLLGLGACVYIVYRNWDVVGDIIRHICCIRVVLPTLLRVMAVSFLLAFITYLIFGHRNVCCPCRDCLTCQTECQPEAQMECVELESADDLLDGQEDKLFKVTETDGFPSSGSYQGNDQNMMGNSDNSNPQQGFSDPPPNENNRNIPTDASTPGGTVPGGYQQSQNYSRSNDVPRRVPLGGGGGGGGLAPFDPALCQQGASPFVLLDCRQLACLLEACKRVENQSAQLNLFSPTSGGGSAAHLPQQQPQAPPLPPRKSSLQSQSQHNQPGQGQAPVSASGNNNNSNNNLQQDVKCQQGYDGQNPQNGPSALTPPHPQSRNYHLVRPGFPMESHPNPHCKDPIKGREETVTASSDNFPGLPNIQHEVDHRQVKQQILGYSVHTTGDRCVDDWFYKRFSKLGGSKKKSDGGRRFSIPQLGVDQQGPTDESQGGTGQSEGSAKAGQKVAPESGSSDNNNKMEDPGAKRGSTAPTKGSQGKGKRESENSGGRRPSRSSLSSGSSSKKDKERRPSRLSLITMSLPAGKKKEAAEEA